MKPYRLLTTVILLVVSTSVPGLEKINGALVADGDVDQFSINNAKTHLYYVADQTVDERDELYAMNLSSGGPYKLSGTLVTQEQIRVRGQSQSGQWLYYERNPSAYVVNINGGAVTNLGAHLTLPGGLQNILIRDVHSVNENTDWILFRWTDGSGDLHLISVLVENGVVNTSVGGILDTGPLYQLGLGPQERISPDGQRVAYIADPDLDDQFDIYTIGIDNGPASQKTAMPSSSQAVFQFQYSADGSRVIYISDERTNDLRELFSVPSTGVPFRATLSGGGLVANASTANLGNLAFRIDPQSNRVLFLESGGGSVNLYSNLNTGGTPTKLNPTIIAPNTDVFNFLLNQSGSHVFFDYISSTDGPLGDMYVSPTDNSQPASAIHSVFPLPDDQRIQIVNAAADPIMYTVRDSSSGISVQTELYLMDTDGGNPREIAKQPGGLISSTILAPDLESIFFGTKAAVLSGGTDYFLSDWDGGKKRKVLSTTIDGSVIYLNGKNVDDTLYFLGTLQDLNKIELFSLPLTDEELCVPIKSSNNAIAIVCL